MIKLAGNLIIENKELLLLYRPEKDHWEVPGGKVKETESPTEAAAREAKEKIGVTVELEKPFYTGEFQHEDKMFIWYSYISSIENSRPKIVEEKFEKLKWFSFQELPENLAPNLRMIKSGLKNLTK